MSTDAKTRRAAVAVRRAASPAAQVWLFIAVLLAGGAALGWTVLRLQGTPAATQLPPWLVLLAGFVAAELLAVHWAPTAR